MRLCTALMVGIFLAGCSSKSDEKPNPKESPPPAQPKTPEEQMKAVAVQFLEDVKAKDWDKVAGQIDVPWYKLKPDSFSMFAESEDAIKSLKGWRETLGPRMEALEIQEVLPYSKASDQVNKRITDPSVIPFMTGALRVHPIDWVAILVVNEKNEKVKVVGMLFIRNREGKARAGGMSE
jgi:hypothetical protein